MELLSNLSISLIYNRKISLSFSVDIINLSPVLLQYVSSAINLLLSVLSTPKIVWPSLPGIAAAVLLG